MNKRAFKDRVYEELSVITKALGNPHRLEIIDLLGQGPFSVEQIANNTGLSIANTSQHLQTLKNARLVSITRDGNFIRYNLANENVYNAWCALRELGRFYNPEVEKIINDFRKSYGKMESIDTERLIKMIEKNEVMLLDVRSEEEFKRGHIHRAISAPLDQLSSLLKTFPKNKMIVAYCRGPFCVYADEAVALLKKKGFRAGRMSEGFPDWSLKGLPVELSKA